MIHWGGGGGGGGAWRLQVATRSPKTLHGNPGKCEAEKCRRVT